MRVRLQLNRSIVHCTYVIRDVYDLSSRLFMLDGYHIGKGKLINLHVHIEGFAEGADFHVVTVSATMGHLLQVTLEDTVDLFGRGSRGIEGGRERSSILSLGVTASTTTRMHFDELLIEVGMLTHVFDCCQAYLAMPRLVAIKLVGEGIEKAVT